jgi:hypothetical protein
MTDPTPAAGAKTPEVWAYAGRRTVDGKARYAYVADAGRDPVGPLLFSRPLGPTHRIGCLYDVMVERKAEGGMSVEVGARLVIAAGEAARCDVPRPEWHVADDAAGAILARKRVEAAAGRARTDLDEVLAPLERLARTLKTRAERDALISRAVSIIITGSGFRL